MPSEWRWPTPEELGWSTQQSPTKRVIVLGDFNGDWLMDGACLVIATDGSRSALLAFMQRMDAQEEWYVLDEGPGTQVLGMGLGVRRPGTAMIRGPSGYDEPKRERVLENDAIHYFRPESASSLILWTHGGVFERIWESD